MTDGKRKILLVDDEPSILKTVGKRLEVKGKDQRSQEIPIEAFLGQSSKPQ